MNTFRKFTYIVILFFISYLAVYLPLLKTDIKETGDYAVNAIQIERAKELKESLGPYSRNGFHHFGPISFYYSALTETFFPFIKSIQRKHEMAQLLLNIILLLYAIHILFISRQKQLSSFLFFPVLLFAVYPTGKDLFISLWGPAMLIMPAALFLVSSAALAQGKSKMLIPLSISSTFMFHNHIGTASIIFPVGFYAIYQFIQNRGGNKPDKKEIYHITGAIALALAAALPPLIQELVSDNGNISLILSFMTEKSAAHRFDVSLHYLFSFYSEPFKNIINVHGVFVFFTFLMATLPSGRNKNSFDYFFRNILILTFITALIGVIKINGELLHFIFWHHYVTVAGFLFLALQNIHARVAELIMPYSGSIYKILVPFTMITVIMVYQPQKKELDSQVEVFYKFINPEKGKTYKLSWDSKENLGQWVIAAGVALEMHRNGINACVENEWLFMFPEDYSCDSENRVNLISFTTIPETLAPAITANSIRYKKTLLIKMD